MLAGDTSRSAARAGTLVWAVAFLLVGSTTARATTVSIELLDEHDRPVSADALEGWFGAARCSCGGDARFRVKVTDRTEDDALTRAASSTVTSSRATSTSSPIPRRWEACGSR